MPSTPTPLPDKNTSSAPRSRSSETDVSRARILAPAAISRTALRVIPGSAPSYVAGVRRAPSETRNTFRAVVSTTRPRSLRRSASNAPSASASRKATDSATREIDLIWLSGPDNRRTVAATCSAGCGGISGRARVVIVAMPRVVERSPAMTVVRMRPSPTPLVSTTFLATWRRSSMLKGGSMRSTSRPTRSRSKWASIRKGAPPWMRTVSKHPSPYRKPRFWGEMRASSSGIKAPSSHTEAVRRHLHAVVREGLRVSAELVERLAVLRVRVRVGDDPASDREVGRLANNRRGADRNVPVDRAIPGDVSDCARVDATPLRLESFDDFHGPRLRRTRDRATGKRGPQELRDRNVFPEPSSDNALEMMHVRERTKSPQEWNVDAAELANFAEVVPLQVDDHHVLRRVFLAREEFLRESLILRGCSTPGPGPLDRTGLNIPVLNAEEPLRACRQKAVVSRLEESSERRWRARPEAFVCIAGRPSERKCESMGQVDLEDLPVHDRPFRFLYRVDEVLRGERVDRSRVGRHRELVWNRRGLVFDSGPRCDHERLAPDPVNDVDARIHREMDVRDLQVRGLLIGHVLKQSTEIVREIAHGSSEERVRRRARRRPR